jgi:hypothetical protein
VVVKEEEEAEITGAEAEEVVITVVAEEELNFQRKT